MNAGGYDRERLEAALQAGGAGRRLHFREELESTQDLAFTLAEHGAPDGTAVLADRQSRGRGRHGRRWESEAGLGVWLSMVLRPPPGPAAHGPLLVAATALGVAEGVEAASGVAAVLRWPNDLLVGDRKLAGILVETRDFEPRAPLLVLGVGLNTGQDAEDFPPGIRAEATSLLLETGTAPDRTEVVEAMFRALDRWLGRLRHGDPASVEEAYAARAAYLRRPVSLLEGSAPLAGVLEGVSPTRGLTLRLPDGALRTVRPEHARELRPEPGDGPQIFT